MSVFAKANARLNMTAAERARLKLYEGFLITGIVAAVTAMPTVLLVKDGQVVLAAGAVSFVVGSLIHGVLGAWAKYVSANGDLPLANALTAADSAISTAFGIPNDTKQGVDAIESPVAQQDSQSPMPTATPA